MARILLEANRIELSYGLRRVLDVESLKIYDGERIGLIGENGAGKSTLLAILCGEMKPDEGSVRCGCGISVIRQMGDVQDEGDGRLRSEFAAQEQREGLSGGERTRRRIAAALSAGGHLLLADEPTGSLDPMHAGSVFDLLLDLVRKNKMAMLFVTHDMNLASRADRIITINNGIVE